MTLGGTVHGLVETFLPTRICALRLCREFP